jgi:hypothetical protein
MEEPKFYPTPLAVAMIKYFIAFIPALYFY